MPMVHDGGQDGSPGRLYSRNGRRLACRPCRRRKLACDNGQPVCQRCLRAKTASLCVYEAGRGERLEQPGKRHQASHPSPELTTPQSISSRSGAVQARARQSQTEFLGPTSITAVLQELGGQVQPPFASTAGVVPSSPDARIASTVHSSAESPSEHTISLAIKVLQSIPDPQTSVALIRRCQSPVDGWVRPAVYHLSESLHNTFKPHGTARNANLARMAHVLCRNMNSTIEQGRENAEEWLASISGMNFRWECVGILFTYWETGIMRRESGNDERSGMTVPDTYMECIHSCLHLCGQAQTGNSLLVHLLIKTLHLSGIHYGDTSLVADRLLAETVAVATNLGMHIATQPSHTSFLTEIRRRLFAHVFVIDKNMAIFTGRPPHLTHRYCSIALPLDVSDEIVMSLPGEPVAIADVAPEKIDKHGWSTEGVILKTTLTRARELMSLLRGEILEIALGVNQPLDIDNLCDIKQRQEEVYRQLPQVLYLDLASDQDLDPKNMPIRFAKSLARLEHLQNLFCIYRLLVKATTSSDTVNHAANAAATEDYRAALARISLDILAVTLTFWTHGTHGLSTMQINYDWIIVSDACPAAGVLCGELLRRDGFASSWLGTGLRRSDVVHHLSLLSGFLTWIGPEASNAHLSGMVKDLIHRVLDQTLNNDPVAVQEAPMGMGMMMPDVDVPDDFHDMFAFDLLDSFDWLRS